jgi:PAS domain S-box-containing protein
MYVNYNKKTIPSEEVCRLVTWRWNLDKNIISYLSYFDKLSSNENEEYTSTVDEWFEQIHLDDRERSHDAIKKIKAGYIDAVSLTYRFYIKPKSYRWMNCVLKVCKRDNNNVLMLNGYQNDIDEYRKNEEFLDEINLRLSKLVENFSGGILLEDEHRKIFFVNDEFCRLFDISVPTYELIGTDCTESASYIKHLFTEPEYFVSSIHSALNKNNAEHGILLRKTNGTILERDYIPITNDDVLKGHLWLYRDVTKLKENEEKLTFRLRFEELITDLSSKFINLEWANTDKEIEDALEMIGTFISVDRSYVFLFSEDKQNMSNTHEWVREGIAREKEILQNIPFNAFPWWFEKIKNQEVIYVSSINEMPPEASSEKDFMEMQHIKSLVMFPMIYQNRAIGFIGLAAMQHLISWTEESVKLLKVAANVITNTIKRKEHEDNLSHERTLLRTIIDNIPDPIYVKDLDGRKILANEAELNILNAKTREDILGKTDFEVYPADVALRTVIEDKMVIDSGKPLINKEGFVITSSGETKWFIGNKIPRKDSQGNVTGIVGISYDITERKKSEEAIKESEKKYRHVVNSIKEVIFSTDAQGLWTFLNPAWTEITGFTIEESLGQNFLNFVHPDDRERNFKLFEPLIQRKKEYCRHEIRYSTKDGGYKWIEVFARLTFDENDNIVGTTGTLNDLTARKQSEEEIRKLSRAVETTPSAIMLADLEGIIVYVNPGLLQMGGYNSSGDILGKNIFEFSNDHGRKILTEDIFPVLMQDKTWTGEVKIKKADNSFLPVELIFSVVFDENDKPQYYLAVFYDITHRKLAEEEIKNALAKEKELNELKSKFVSMVSHEFRTPLAAINSSSDLLHNYWDKLTVEKRNSLLEKINRSINNLVVLLNDVTEINRADSGKAKIQYEQINAIQFIDDVIEELNLGFAVKPAIHFEKENDSLSLVTDTKYMRLIAVNLISNAIKYTPANKNVFLSANKDEDKFLFIVKDEGIGIPQEDFKNMYEPFMRSKNAENIKGTGLGLSILKRAVDLLEGTIEFDSAVNIGTTFTVTIPINGTNKS